MFIHMSSCVWPCVVSPSSDLFSFECLYYFSQFFISSILVIILHVVETAEYWIPCAPQNEEYCLWRYTTLTKQHQNNTQQHTTTHNNNNTIWGGSVLTGEEPPPHSGELKHALPQASGPTQSQLSRPMSSGHHIFMEHRLRRKQLNSDTNASKKKYLKEIQEKWKEETFSSEKWKMKNI